LFANFCVYEEIRDDLHTVLTGEFAAGIKDQIFPTSYTLSNQYRNFIDGVLWFKNLEFEDAWETEKSKQIMSKLYMLIKDNRKGALT